MKNTNNVKKTAVIGMLCALAFVFVLCIRIPIVLFLKYEPKDIIIAIGGFIYGPLGAAVISLIVALIELVTISDTGFIGFIMNFLSSAAFTVPAAFIYSKRKNLSGAIIGLFTGVLCVTATMLLWNMLISPLYMKVTREEIMAMLPTMFLPFNFFKGMLNATFTMLLYKPVVRILRKIKLLPAETGTRKNSVRSAVLITVTEIAVAALCVAAVIIIW